LLCWMQLRKCHISTGTLLFTNSMLTGVKQVVYVTRAAISTHHRSHYLPRSIMDLLSIASMNDTRGRVDTAAVWFIYSICSHNVVY
jgi:hypothetical protein